MRIALIGVAAATALAGAAVAQDGEAPVPAMGPHGIAEETTVGVLHAAGYEVAGLQTSPATDARVNRFGFLMAHPDGSERPLYACRLMIGSGEEETDLQMIMINKCHILK